MISDKWKHRHMREAYKNASYSKDPSTKVGCVAVDQDNNIVISGYNGIPRGIADTEERLNNRKIKYEMCLHAEQNMIANAARVGASLRNKSVFITRLPCPVCCGMLINAGVEKIFVPTPTDEEYEQFYCRWNEKMSLSLQMIDEVDIQLEYIDIADRTIS